ncbi:MAG TPA: ABC transporter ATP-binding protein, partial [Baekduia sp.]|nr:ABC transporter ATP-binding protein [Baekduia sp.]
NELFDIHEPDTSKDDRAARIKSTLEEVKLPTDDDFLKRFPHQLSGGQLQRVCLAMAFLLRPRLIVLDEPTTGLDVTTQAHVLRTVKELCGHHSVAALYITHDLAVVGNLCDRMLVMYAGSVVESGSIDSIFRTPAHPYTRGLLAAVPDLTIARVLKAIGGQAPRPGTRPSGCRFSDRCPYVIDICKREVPPNVAVAAGHTALCHRVQELAGTANLTWETKERPSLSGEAILRASEISVSYGATPVLYDVSVEVARRECLAIVGESGSGKTTLARVIVGQLTNATGEVSYRGETLAPRARDRTRKQRQEVQYIFQSPYSSLNPRHNISTIIERPIGLLFDVNRAERRRRAIAALELVSLPATTLETYPSDLSGGERQRVAIACALACEPTVMVCDEITSALDVSVQAGIVELLDRLQTELDLSLIFVTHNLALVRNIADRVAVVQHGRVVETGPTTSVLDQPDDDYTKLLLSDTPAVLAQ